MKRPACVNATPLETGDQGCAPSPASVSAARASTPMLVPAGSLPAASVFQVIVPQVAPGPPSCVTVHVPVGLVFVRTVSPVASVYVYGRLPTGNTPRGAPLVPRHLEMLL